MVDALGTMVGGLTVGDPSDPATEIGPLVARTPAGARREVHRPRSGRRRRDRRRRRQRSPRRGQVKGWYVQPTVFSDVNNDMRIRQEEIFGPVLAVIPFDGVDDAIRIANDLTSGSRSVWTADIDRGLDVARRVRTGTTASTSTRWTSSRPLVATKAPESGASSVREGLEHYLELKSIVPPAGS